MNNWRSSKRSPTDESAFLAATQNVLCDCNLTASASTYSVCPLSRDSAKFFLAAGLV